jgi:formylglycine-generating enzyme required for sulfatase activity
MKVTPLLFGLTALGWLLLRPRAGGEPSGASQPSELVVPLGGGVTMEFVLIRPGSFLMGSDREPYLDARPVHKVTITRPFYMGRYEVTQEQWERVRGEHLSLFREPQFPGSRRRPVENLRWDDCLRFAAQLDGKVEGFEFRLPTEAEWEYACRAGTKEAYGFGDDAAGLAQHAWYADNARGQTHPVGEKRPNAWGLYDMHGNVWEWCSDFYGPYPGAPLSDPAGAASGTHVLRGGAWNSAAEHLTAAYRHDLDGDDFYSYYGFRCVAVRSASG